LPTGDIYVYIHPSNDVPRTQILEDTFIHTDDASEDITTVLAQALAVDNN
jgi:hypothetical protein